MADPVHYLHVCGDAFYFRVETSETDVCLSEDAFRMSDRCIRHLFRNKNNKYLVLDDHNQFQVQMLNMKQIRQPGNKFVIQVYSDSSRELKTGRPVILYAEKGVKKMVVCCTDSQEIHAQAMELPRDIHGSEHKAVFYMKELPRRECMFQSSVFPNMYLGFESDPCNSTLVKLVLHQKVDEVDEASLIRLM